MNTKTGRCEKCGNANLYTNVNCTVCGARLPWADAVQSTQDSTPPPPQNLNPQPGTYVGPVANPPQTANPNAVIATIIFLILVAIPLSCTFFSPFGGPGASLAQTVVTMDEYTQIQNGMTYEQVKAIVGDPGQEISRSEIAGYSGFIYTWKNPNGSNVIVQFQNDRVITKAQAGLQ